MLNFFALGVIALSILFAVAALIRERRIESEADTASRLPGGGILIDPAAQSPATLSEFDPNKDSLLVQLPAREVLEMDEDDFFTRPAADGDGQDLLYCGRVLLHLPGVAPDRHIDLYVEPIPA